LLDILEQIYLQSNILRYDLRVDVEICLLFTVVGRAESN